MQNCWHPQPVEQRNLNLIGMVAARKSMLLFHTPYCRESSNDSWFVCYYAHVPTTNAKLLTPSAMGATKFERDRNGCNEKKSVTIPNSNCSQSSNSNISWFVSYYVHVPRINAKLLTPSARGATKFEFDRNGCSKKKYVTIPYSICRESSNDSWFVSYYAHVPRINAKLLTTSARGAMKFEFDRNGFSNKKYITIPYFNRSESSKDSWFVSYYAHVLRINAKLLTPSTSGSTKFEFDRNGCSKKKYVTIPYSIL